MTCFAKLSWDILVTWPTNFKTLLYVALGRTQGGSGLKPPLELDISQKLYYLRKGV